MRLDIHCDNLNAEVVRWALCDSGGILDRGEGSLEKLAAAMANRDLARTILWLAGEDVLEILVHFPTRRRSRMLRAAPYLVEEYLAGDVDKIHWVLDVAPGTSAYHRIALLDDPGFGDLIARLGALGLPPDAAYADYVGLDAGSDADVLIAMQDGRCAVRSRMAGSGQSSGMAVPDDLLPDVMRNLTQGRTGRISIQALYVRDRPGAAQAENTEHSSADDQGEALLLARSLADLDIDPPDLREPLVIPDLLAVFKEPANASLNLCASSYAPKPRKTAFAGSWQAPLWLAALWLLLFVSQQGYEAFLYDRAGDGVRADAEDLYRSYFPEDRRLTADLVRQARANGIAAQGIAEEPADFLAILGVLSTVVSSQADQDLRIREVSYSRPRGESAVELDVGSFALLNQFQGGFSAQGFSAEISFANQVGDRVRARLRMQRLESPP